MFIWRTNILSNLHVYDASRAKTPKANPLSANEYSGQNHPGRKHDRPETTRIQQYNTFGTMGGPHPLYYVLKDLFQFAQFDPMF